MNVSAKRGGEPFDPLEELRRPETWSEEMQTAVEAALPPYRLSKFQRALPDWAQREMLAGYLLDWEGALGVVAEGAGEWFPA